MKFLRQIYRVWGIFWFVFPMLIFLPFFHITALKDSWHKYASMLNRIWAWIFFHAIFIPVRVKYKFKPSANQTCVYCSNHTSWLDIATFGRIMKGDFVFLGKKSLTRIPLFGPMFAKIHITVDRSSREDSYQALQKSMEAIELGRNLIVFPEGGIKGTEQPKLNPFKDGAFKIAIEKKVPIVPVTILYNWFIFDKTFIPRWRPCEVIMHTPVFHPDYTIKDIEKFKQEVFDIIEEDLKPLYPKNKVVEPSVKSA